MQQPTVFIVDDDAGVRDSLSLLLGLHGLSVQVFSSAEGFLSTFNKDWPGCVLVDVRMADMGGLALQRILADRYPTLPIIIMTAHANVAAARTAFKAGAVDFLMKPLSETELLEAIQEAMGRRPHLMATATQTNDITHALILLEGLSGREKQILRLLAEGLTSRQVSVQLNISHRTVETYKGRMMEKLNAHKLTDLVRLATMAMASHLCSN